MQWKQFVLNKNSRCFHQKRRNFLTNMTTNSRQVILPGEMVQLVLVNAAVNHILQSDRGMPKNPAIVFTRLSYCGSVCKTELSRRQTSSVFLSLVYHSNGPVRFSSSSARTLPIKWCHCAEQVPA